jgi:hypothetical protein
MNHSENYLSIVSCPLVRRFFFLQSQFLIVFHLALVASFDLRSRLVLQVSTPHPSSPIYSFQTANWWQQKPPIPSFFFRRFQTFCHFTISLIFFSFNEFLLGLIFCCWNLEVLSAKVVNLQNLHENSGCWSRVCVLIPAKDWILSQLCDLHLYPMVFIGWVCPGIMTLLWSASSRRKSWRLQIDITNLLFTTCNFWALL